MQGAADFDRSGATETRLLDLEQTAVKNHYIRCDRPIGPCGRATAAGRRTHTSGLALYFTGADDHRTGLWDEISTEGGCLWQNGGHGRRRANRAPRDHRSLRTLTEQRRCRTSRKRTLPTWCLSAGRTFPIHV